MCAEVSRRLPACGPGLTSCEFSTGRHPPAWGNNDRYHLAGSVGFYLGLQAGELERRAFGQVYLGSMAFIADFDSSAMLTIDLDHVDDPLKHARRVTEQGGVLNVPAEAELPGRLNLQVEISTRYGSAELRGAQVPLLVSEQLVPPFR